MGIVKVERREKKEGSGMRERKMEGRDWRKLKGKSGVECGKPGGRI
jgi:hypothetical protein